ncbi:rCG51263 [Rattus norvegicus]|uniref:RCG51263 n=1 Tax=Rattus norvegicus TaxID=10116 RepID=A6IZF0_RAT|nr:rCG51263 [Rattus norvegicus]
MTWGLGDGENSLRVRGVVSSNVEENRVLEHQGSCQA